MGHKTDGQRAVGRNAAPPLCFLVAFLSDDKMVEVLEFGSREELAGWKGANRRKPTKLITVSGAYAVEHIGAKMS